MPFLSVTLLWVLNSDRMPSRWRTKPPSSNSLVLCTLAFGALAVNELVKALELL